MSVYTQCRRTIPHQILGRSLTGFGPAAAAEEMLKTDRNRVSALFCESILDTFCMHCYFESVLVGGRTGRGTFWAPEPTKNQFRKCHRDMT